jgi:hypothetical protein
VAQSFPAFVTDIQYRDFIHLAMNDQFNVNAFQQITPDAAMNLAAMWDLQGWIKAVDVQLIYANNLAEADRSQIYDIASFLENIEFQIANMGAVNLSTLETNVQSINSNVASIMQSVGGGSSISFAEIDRTLTQSLAQVAMAVQDVAGQLFTDNGILSNILTIPNDRTISEVTRDGLGDIAAVLAALLPIIRQTANVTDPATQKIADNTLSVARLAALSNGAVLEAGVPNFTDFFSFLSSLDVTAAAKQLGKLLSNAFDAVPEVFSTESAQRAKDEFLKEVETVKSSTVILDVTEEIKRQSAALLSPAIKFMFQIVGFIAEIAEPASKALFDPAFEAILKVVKTRVQSHGMVSPTQGFGAAADWLSAAASQGMHAHHLAHLIEMIPSLKNFGLNTLPAFLSDMAGYGEIAKQTWGKAIGEGVGRPAGYEINALMRSKIPDEQGLRSAVQRRQLSIQEFGTLMTYHGYHDNYVAMAVDTVWRNPSLREILLLVQDTPVEQPTIEWLLRDAGYGEDLMAKIIPALMRKRTRNERDQLVGEVRANLAQGFLTEEDARLYFEQVGMGSDEIDLSLQTARLAFRRGRMADNLATLQNEFTSNLMEAGDFTLAARAQGISEARIASELFAIEVKRNGTVAHQETADAKAEVRHQQSLVLQEFRVLFQHGLVSPAGFEQALVQSGILPATARLTVELEQVKLEGRAGSARSAAGARLTAKEIKLREDTFIELFRKGIISNLQLEISLRQLGLSDAIVSATVSKELAAKILTAADLLKTPAGMKAKELFTLAKATLQVQFAKAAIDADSYLQQLVLLGVDEAVARATVKLEVAKRSGEKQPPKAAATDSKALTAIKAQVAALEDQATAGKISGDDFSAALERIGLLEQTIDALIAQLDEEQAAAAAAQTAVN